MALQANFRNSQVIDPYKGVQATLANLGGQLADYQKGQDVKAQNAIANKRADEALAIKQAQESRAANEAAVLAEQRQAMKDATVLPTNILPGQAGQEAFETGTVALTESLMSPAEKKFDYYGKSAAIQQLPETTPAEIQAKTAAQNELMKGYQAVAGDTSARDKLLEGISRDYSTVHEASGYDGLKANKADAGYEDRVYRALVAGGLDPVAAKAQATTQAAMFKPAPLTKSQEATRDSAIKTIDDTTKQQLDVIKNQFEKGKISGSASKRGSNGYGKSTIKEAVETLGFSDSMFSSGASPVSATQLSRQVLNSLRDEGVSESDVADAMYDVTTGRSGEFFSLDPDIAKKELYNKAVELSGKRKASQASGAGKLYNKYGPAYASAAQNVLDKAAARKAVIANQFATPDRGDTGLQSLLGRLDKETKATPVKTTKPPTTKVVKDTTKSLGVDMTDTAVKKIQKEVAKDSPKVQQENIAKAQDAIANDPNPYENFRSRVDAISKKVDDNQKLSPVEAGIIQMMFAGAQKLSKIPEDLSAIDDAISTGDRNLEAIGSNVLTGAGNLFRSRSNQQPYRELPGF